MKEKQEREEKDRDLPKDQLTILQALEPRTGRGMRTREVAKKSNLAEDETDVHLERLHKREFAIEMSSGWGDHGPGIWYRTTQGTEHLMAKRLAGEIQQQQPRGDELEDDALQILLAMGQLNDHKPLAVIAHRTGLHEAVVQHYLDELRDAELVMFVMQYSDEEMLSGIYVWGLERKGRAYLVKRGLLKADPPPF